VSEGPFTPDVVAAIVRHMNEEHAGDTLLMVRVLGDQPDAESAAMTGVDAHGADFVARVGGTEVPVRLAWRKRLTERKQVRQEVVRLYREAADA
jgi:putative heme iron utilization protein